MGNKMMNAVSKLLALTIFVRFCLGIISAWRLLMRLGPLHAKKAEEHVFGNAIRLCPNAFRICAKDQPLQTHPFRMEIALARSQFAPIKGARKKVEHALRIASAPLESVPA